MKFFWSLVNIPSPLDLQPHLPASLDIPSVEGRFIRLIATMLEINLTNKQLFIAFDQGWLSLT